MKVLRTASLTLVASLVGALGVSGASVMVRLGSVPLTASPAVLVYDASDPAEPKLVNRTPELATAGPHVTSDELLFVAQGRRLSLLDRRLAGLPELAAWTSEGTILSLASVPERGMVLVLDDSSLSLVKFPDSGTPRAIWSHPMAASSVAGPKGRLLARDGNFAYVADASLPGIRVLSLDHEAAPSTVATFVSPGGPVHDISLWNRTLSLLTEDSLLLLDAGNPDLPILTLRGAFGTTDRPVAAEVNSRWAFLAVGTTILVLDINPASPGFLQGPVDSYTVQAPVVSLRLDRKSRLYALEAGGYEILDIGPFGGK